MSAILESYPAAAPATETPAAGAIDQLLRNPKALVDRIESGEDAAAARTFILVIAASSGVFGMTLGAFRGGLQILYAGVKLPLVVLLTAALSAPALAALNAAVEGRWSFRRDAARVLASLALGSLVLAALAPALFLAMMLGAAYHTMIVLTVACCAVGGTVGLRFFQRGIEGARQLAAGLALAVFALVGADMSWVLRPYLVRPRTEQPPIVRAVEGGLLDAVQESVGSVLGLNETPAPRPGSEP